MWKKAESNIRPLELDKKASSSVVYIRRNIIFIDATEEKDAHYEYDEQIIPVNEWSLYEGLIKGELTTLEDAIIELAGIIGE